MRASIIFTTHDTPTATVVILYTCLSTSPHLLLFSWHQKNAVPQGVIGQLSSLLAITLQEYQHEIDCKSIAFPYARMSSNVLMKAPELSIMLKASSIFNYIIFDIGTDIHLYLQWVNPFCIDIHLFFQSICISIRPFISVGIIIKLNRNHSTSSYYTSLRPMTQFRASCSCSSLTMKASAVYMSVSLLRAITRRNFLPTPGMNGLMIRIHLFLSLRIRRHIYF